MEANFKLGIIKVLTKNDPDWLTNHGRIIEKFYPDVETVSRVILNQPEGIHDQVSQAKAEPKIEALAREFVAEGMDGIFVSCAADPALARIRTWARLPITGAGRPVALMALAQGQPVGVLGLSEDPPPAVSDFLGRHLCGAAAPQGVETANDLYVPGGEEFFVEPAKRLLDRGAKAIALACTGFSTVGVAAGLTAKLGVPVVDPVIAAGGVIRFMMITQR